MGKILGRKAGQAARPAGAKFSSRTPQFSSKTDRFSTETAKFLLGAATLSVRNTALASVGSTQEAPLLCSWQQTPLVGPHHAPLFATADSFGRTTSRSSGRNSRLLCWHHSTFLCWYTGGGIPIGLYMCIYTGIIGVVGGVGIIGVIRFSVLG